MSDINVETDTDTDRARGRYIDKDVGIDTDEGTNQYI